MSSLASQESNELVEEMLAHLEPPIALVDQEKDSLVSKFYAGRCVFITGATGFIGKALIEKLIRSCCDIKRIYILVREKRGKCIRERLNDLIESQCFDRIRLLHHGSNEILEEKLYPIQGDITLDKFGISSADMQLLSRDCSIVFNSAATIRFVEPLDVAVRNNIYSVGQLIEFCNQLNQLEALVHLSTAYSNCHMRDTIDEKFYEPPMSGQTIQSSIETLQNIQSKINAYPSCKMQHFYPDNIYQPDQLENNTKNTKVDKNVSGDEAAAATSGAKKLGLVSEKFNLLSEFTRIALRLSNRPNTYTFTKAISESYLLDKARARSDRYLDNKIPVAIVRPSIVGGAWREPIVGLVDNFNGPTGAILSLYTGALLAMPGSGERVADLVPVDMVANMVLCAGWFLVERRDSQTNKSLIKQDQGAYLFNFVSGYRNPLLWHVVTDKICELAYKYPSKFMTRLPSSYFIRAGVVYELYDRLNQKLPAFLMDFVRRRVLNQQVDRRTSAMVAYGRIKQMTDTLTPFTSNQWTLCDSNVCALFNMLNPSDKLLFHFDVKSIKWPEYIRSYIIGSRIYTLKDGPENISRALAQLKTRKLANTFTLSLLFLFAYLFLFHGTALETKLVSCII